jgi:hypothetical protein
MVFRVARTIESSGPGATHGIEEIPGGFGVHPSTDFRELAKAEPARKEDRFVFAA